jgi:hypothetical protein
LDDAVFMYLIKNLMFWGGHQCLIFNVFLVAKFWIAGFTSHFKFLVIRFNCLHHFIL